MSDDNEPSDGEGDASEQRSHDPVYAESETSDEEVIVVYTASIMYVS